MNRVSKTRLLTALVTWLVANAAWAQPGGCIVELPYAGSVTVAYLIVAHT
jgi:hypothetical protein